MGPERRLLVAYDIPDDRRRSRIAKALSSFGDRIQYSVFIVDVTPAAHVRLVARVRGLMKAGEDSVLVCDLGAPDGARRSRIEFIGVARHLTEPDSFIV